MTKDTAREERLAAKLRENLRRRKSQARGNANSADGAGEAQDTSQDLSNRAEEG